MPVDTAYSDLKNQIIKAERRILKELGFCVHFKHPHKVCTLSFLYNNILRILESSRIFHRKLLYIHLLLKNLDNIHLLESHGHESPEQSDHSESMVSIRSKHIYYILPIHFISSLTP